MIAPTSVSSRFNASPVTLFPKSSISFSIASVSPSILATLSPISRTIPTFCFAGEVLTPAICASMVSNILVIKQISDSRQTLLQALQPPRHRSIINVAPHVNSQSPEQLRLLLKRIIQARPVLPPQRVFQIRFRLRCHGGRAFHFRRAALNVQLHQMLQMHQNAKVSARLFLR